MSRKYPTIEERLHRMGEFELVRFVRWLRKSKPEPANIWTWTPNDWEIVDAWCREGNMVERLHVYMERAKADSLVRWK